MAEQGVCINMIEQTISAGKQGVVFTASHGRHLQSGRLLVHLAELSATNVDDGSTILRLLDYQIVDTVDLFEGSLQVNCTLVDKYIALWVFVQTSVSAERYDLTESAAGTT